MLMIGKASGNLLVFGLSFVRPCGLKVTIIQSDNDKLLDCLTPGPYVILTHNKNLNRNISSNLNNNYIQTRVLSSLSSE